MQNYNFIEKFLHDFVLKNKIVNKSLFEIEKFFFLRKKKIEYQKHIFISGLPRSGSTALLNFIYSFKKHGSLTYRNMPFLLSPNISKIFSKQNNILKKVRLHKDGLSSDLNSPEAFDEVFFNNDYGYVKKELKNYIQLILLSENKSNYLNKNNLNFRRINLIQQILPSSIFLIPVREPLQHAYSLLTQHLNFSKLQKQDYFIRRYMNYLGHNEFGLDHIPWNKPINYHNFNDLNYWIEQWTLFYEEIYRKYKFNSNCNFILYERLTDTNYIEILKKKLSLQNDQNEKLDYFLNSNKENLNFNFNETNYKNAQLFYQNFSANKL